LCNTDLYVPRERLPVLEPEEFYYADLVGLRAEDTAGRAIGRVVAVHNFGAGDILEIAPVAAGRIVVAMPQGVGASIAVAEQNEGA
jgi:16S rRNA processing protein RimM